MIRRHIAALRFGLAAVDAISGMIVFAIVSAIRFGSDWPGVWNGLGVDPLFALLAYGGAWSVALWLQGLYRLRARWSIRRELLDIIMAAAVLAVGTFAALYLFKLPDVSRLLLIALFPAQVVATLITRLAIRFVFVALRERGYNARFVLVVGANRIGQSFGDRIERHRELGLRVVGHLAGPGEVDAEGRATYTALTRPIIGTVDQIEDILHGTVVDEVVVCLPFEAHALVEPITRLCEDEGRIVRIPVLEGTVIVPGGRLEEFDGIQILSLVHGPDRIAGLAAKRLIDIAVGGIALILLSPILAAVAVAIRTTEGPPVLFRQTRVGLHGRPFEVLKFRTMSPDAEDRLAEVEDLNEIQGHAFKLTDDPRLTRIGRWLRQTSLDELPQLVNVLRGEMSLVGPRPPLPREVAGYGVWHRRRLSMKPGITGLWQVAARREAEFDRWVAIDLDYIDRWSLWLDLKIMLRTIPAMLLQQGR